MRKDLPQLEIAWIGFGGQRKVLGRFRKTLRAVIAHTKQRARLQIAWLGGQSCGERSDGSFEAPLLEFREAEIQLDSRELGVECQSLSVGGRGLRIFL